MEKTKYITNVLLCKPTHFSVDYVINPWMKPGTVSKERAYRQWNSLVETILDLGINVTVVNQEKGLPDMVFAADQGIVKNKNVVISNFHFKQRRNEVRHYIPWFEKQNLNIYTLPNSYFFEGSGECVWLGELLLVGTGFRNSPNVCQFLSKYLKVETKCLELINPNFYHLDTCLFPLNSKTAFYYPNAFSQESKNKLKKLIPNLIALSDHDANNFAANSLVTDHHVIMQKGNKDFSKKITSLGYKSVELDVSEFMKSGGGIHCLVQTLEEKYD